MFHLGLASQMMAMMPWSRPVEEPMPRVISIRKNRTENTWNKAVESEEKIAEDFPEVSYLRVPGELPKRHGVRYECQSGAALDHLADRKVQLISQIAKDREDGEAGQQRCEGVHEGNDEGIPT